MAVKFSLTKYDHKSVTVKVEGISKGDTVRILVQLESDSTDATRDESFVSTGRRMTKTLDGLQASTNYLVYVMVNGDGWLDTVMTFYTTAAPTIYTIYLDADGGKGGTDQVEFEANADLPRIETPTKSGFVFKGYFTEENGNGVQYYDEYGEGTRTYNGPYSAITIFAYWVKVHKIYFDVVGGAYVEVIKNETVPDIDPPVKEGYRFLGYFTEENGAGVQYYDEDGTGLVAYNGSWEYITIFAYWQKIGTGFAWATEKVAGEPFQLGATEWNALCAFVNAKRKTPYSFTEAKSGYPFTAAIYNEMVAAIGVGSTVKPRDPVTADLLNDLVANANKM